MTMCVISTVCVPTPCLPLTIVSKTPHCIIAMLSNGGVVCDMPRTSAYMWGGNCCLLDSCYAVVT